ncbi:hypothetical protein LOZ58_006856 [Ophidiomyces ophidiicola]|nr:hypothetical protein LOZ58_006856 [Ophidiomyces ophidiicola]
MASPRMYRLADFFEVRERFEVFKAADIKDEDHEPITGELLKQRKTLTMITVGLQFIQQCIATDIVPGHEAINLLCPLDRIVMEVASTAETQTLKELLQILPKIISNVILPADREEAMVYRSLQWLSKLYPGWTFRADKRIGGKRRVVQKTNPGSELVMKDTMQKTLVWLAKILYWYARLIVNLWAYHRLKPIPPSEGLRPADVTVVIPCVGIHDKKLIKALESVLGNRPQTVILATIEQERQVAEKVIRNISKTTRPHETESLCETPMTGLKRSRLLLTF